MTTVVEQAVEIFRRINTCDIRLSVKIVITIEGKTDLFIAVVLQKAMPPLYFYTILKLCSNSLLGAFYPGLPVQPVLLRYPNKVVSFFKRSPFLLNLCHIMVLHQIFTNRQNRPSFVYPWCHPILVTLLFSWCSYYVLNAPMHSVVCKNCRTVTSHDLKWVKARVNKR